MKIRAILMDMDGTLLGKSQVAVSVRNMQDRVAGQGTVLCLDEKHLGVVS